MKRISIFKTLATLFVVISLFSLNACSKKETENYLLYLVPQDGLILAVGDSLTYGTGAARQYSYPYQLENIIQRRVINEGVPGIETTATLKRLPGLIQKYHPDLILLCIGGNDFLRNRDDQVIKSNLEKMIQLIQSKDIDLILIATPKPGLFLSPPDYYEELAERYNIPIDIDSITEIEKDASFKSDSIHLNADGYKILAQNIAHLLKENGAV